MLKNCFAIILATLMFMSVSFALGENEKPIYITDIQISGIPDEILIGERIPFEVTVLPENHTEGKYRFGVKLGTSSQVTYEDGRYYFRPVKTGRNILTVKSESGRKAEVEFWVRSPIDGIDIVVSNLIKENNKYVLYVGQSLSPSVDFDLKTEYKNQIVYYNDVKWTVSNNLIATVSEDGDMPIITGRQQGFTKVTAEALDGEHQDDFVLWVKSPLKSFELKNSNYNLYEYHNIDLQLELIEDLIYAEQLLELKPPMTYSIEEQWLHESVLRDEIEYEKNFIKLKGDNANNEHQERLIRLEASLKTKNDLGYCKLLTSYALKDRYGRPLKVARIDNEQIIGYFPGKVTIKGKLEGTSKFDLAEVVLIGDYSNNVIISTGGAVVYVPSKLDNNEFLQRIKGRFAHLSLSDIPSKTTIASITQLEEKIDLTEKFKVDYSRNLCDDDLIELREILRDNRATYEQLVDWQLYIEGVGVVNLENALVKMLEILS